MKPKTTASPAILVIGGNAEQLAWTANVVRSVAPSAESRAQLDDVRPIDELDLIVANYNGLHGRDRRRLLDVIDRDSDDAPRLLLIASSAEHYQPMIRELEEHRLTNLLALDGEVSESELLITVQKLLRSDIFGLDKYFAPDVEQTTIEIHRSCDLAGAVDLATKFANDLGIHPRLVENTATVVDELVTNAVYNAPVDADGNYRYAHLPRTSPVELGPGEEVTLAICCDGRQLGVSVADNFGALTKKQSLDYLARSIRRQPKEPRTGKGGAGLGLYMTFDALNHMVLNICQNRKTEVIGLIDIRGSYKDFVRRGKSFNIFLCTRGE